MSTLVIELARATAGSLGLALGGVLLALPLALATGWCAAAPGRGPVAARQALRFLGSLPITLVGLLAFSSAPTGMPLTAALLALTLGAYAPVALAACGARSGQGRRSERDALALGLSPRAVLVGVVLPILRVPLLAAVLRATCRLVGETGLFLLVGAARGPLPPTLGAGALAGAVRGALPVELAVLVVLSLALNELALRVEREARA